MIYEVRDYHIRPDIYEAYKAWGEEAVPILRELFDVVGFWIEAGEAHPEISGSDPIGAPIGEANVTWIIRWPDKATRDREIQKAFASDAWKDVWSRHPDPEGYLQSSSRFMTEV